MKGKKIIVSALVATMVGAPVAVLNSATSSAYAGTPVNEDANEYVVVGPSVKVKNNYTKTASVGDTIEVPQVLDKEGTDQETGTYKSNADKVDITVIKPNGDVLDLKGATTFQAEMVGTYTFRFECYDTVMKDHDNDPATDEVEVRSSIVSTYDLYCEVTGDSGSLELPVNSYYVVPTEFVKGKTLTVPVPKAFVNDSEIEDIDPSSAKAVVLNQGTADEKTIYVYELEDGSYAQIKAFLTKVGSNSAPIEMAYNVATGTDYNKLAYFSHTFANEDASIGTYKLVYKLYRTDVAKDVVKEKVDPIAVSNSKTIKVKSSLTSNKMYITWASTPKKSAEVGVKYNLVNVNATFTEGSTDYVNAFTEIVVKHKGTNEQMVVDYNDMSFVPKYKGNYYIEYKAVIPSLNISSNVLSYAINDVSDSTDPVMYLTESYKIEDGVAKSIGGKKLDGLTKEQLYDEVGDASHYVRSYYKLNNEGKVTVKIPAVYVSDNFSSIENIKVTRNLYKGRSASSNDNKLTLINSVTNEEYAFNEVAEYEFTTANNYMVRYIIEDESGCSIINDYNITIKSYEDDVVVGEPTLTFKYDEEMVSGTDTIKFDVPTATDEYDSNLLIETYYGFEAPNVVNNKITNLSTGYTKLKNVDIENNNYVLDVAKAMKEEKHVSQNHQYLYLISFAKNDYDEKLTENKNYIVKKILVLGANESDKDAPDYQSPYDNASFNAELVEINQHVVDYKLDPQGNPTDQKEQPQLNEFGYRKDADKNGDTEALFDQDDIVYIPAITFKDVDTFVNFDIKVSYKNGDETIYLNGLESGYRASVEPIYQDDDKTKDIIAYNHTISGASFRASYAKTYTITIVATDSNGNVSFSSFAVNVNDTQPPVINIENNAKFTEDVEVGTKFTVPAPRIYDNDEIDPNATWEWSLTDPNGAKYYFSSYSRTFTPEVLGTYIVQYSAMDDASNENVSSEYRFNVVAEDAPEFVNANEIAVSLQDQEDAYVWDTTKTTQLAVTIPVATAREVNIDGSIKVDAPVVKNSKGEERTVTKNADGEWQFTPNVQGTYTITYSAQGKYLNNSKEFSITLGDGDAPTMVWANKEEDFKSTVNVGDSWTFKFNMITADDEVSDMPKLISNIIANGVTPDSVKDLEKYMVITMKDPNNKTVEYSVADGGLNYTFNESGSYTFKIVLKDEAGNTTGNTYSYTITASEEKVEEETKNDSAIGTVLIVLSVVILAGVVAYFAITTKQVDNKGKGKKTNKKDDKNEKNDK